jgi:DNA modification methylase
MFVFTKGKPKTFNPIDDRPNKRAGLIEHRHKRKSDSTFEPEKLYRVKPYGQRFNVWNCPSNGTHQTSHPAIFPQRLIEGHINVMEHPGRLVFDPFMGSGTTALACEALGRRWIGSEISEEYAQAAIARIQKLVAA